MKIEIGRPAAIAAGLLAAALILAGCDSRPEVDIHSADAERPAAGALVVELTTLEGVALVDSSFHDGCDSTDNGQPIFGAEKTHEFWCSTGRAAMYGVADAGAVASAAAVHEAFVEKGCTSEEPLNGDADALAEVESQEDGTHIIESFYACGDSGVRVIFGAAGDPRITEAVNTIPAGASSDDRLQSEPVMGTDAITAAEAQGITVVAMLEASEKYYSVKVCGGRKLCE